MMVPCPVCKTPFEESKLPEHMSRDHAEMADPEIQRLHQPHGDKCIICGAILPSPEALSEHNRRVHQL
ncbi:MAG: hypothetical protein L3K15_04440 [Thermoplasmata archaeon]|nr:hypothetical protein [Thermoplasmata archaeon]